LATASIWALAASASAAAFGAVAAGRVVLCIIGAVITAFTGAGFAATSAGFATALTTAAVVASAAFATSPIAALARASGFVLCRRFGWFVGGFATEQVFKPAKKAFFS
jgi:hypothetical protein